jgi:diguanylate cyclase (GGDEF)-like protein/PAS domain S-box-containing protein
LELGYPLVDTSRSDRNVTFAFGAALLAVLLVGSVSYRAVAVFSDSNLWVRHTDEVLKTLQDLLICVKSIESDARGYVLTGNEFYAQSLPDLKLKAERDLANIGNLTADNAVQQRRMPALKSLAAQKIQFSERGVELRRNQGPDAFVEALRGGHGEKIKIDFQELVGQMRDEELRLLTLRDADALRRLRTTKISLVLGTLAGLLIALAAGWKVHREHLARDRAEEAMREGEERFRTLANNIAQIAWMAEANGNIFWYNDRWFEFSGATLEEMLASGWEKFHNPDHLQRVVDGITHCFQSGEIWEDTFPLRGEDGIERWFLSRAVPLRNPQGQVWRWFGTNTDISDRIVAEEHLAATVDQLRRSHDERKIVEDELFREKERAQVTLDSIGDAVACTDYGGNISFFNLVAERMTGWSRQEAIGRPMAEVLNILNATSRERIPNLMEMAVDHNRSMHLPPKSVLIRRDGFEIPIEDSVAPIRDRAGQPTGAVIVFRDVSVARALALQVAHAAQHDVLTGLPNRMLLSDRITQDIALARRHNKKVGVLFLDLDGFKHINDSLGHPIGDKLLESVARRLADCVRGTDTVSRQGGDEFVVSLSEMEKVEDAAVTARRMLRAVAKAHSVEGHELYVTTSIGVSAYPDDGLDAETLIKNADTAMYQAKEHGRQNYQFFKPAMNVRAVERQSIEESLRRALERDEFSLHYQPKVNLSTGEVTGAEALLRWTHPTRGSVPPSEFISVAEDCGLILPIGHWVLLQACKQARSWLDAGLSLGTMAVNISAIEFRDANFLDGVFTILKETGLDPGALELELTESVLMKHAGSTESILKSLRAKGVQLAVDDFGTGYSSLSYLRKFPLDSLKIDQSFVRQITTAPDETTIVTAIISMGRSLKLRVVAEGVETQEELAFLQAHFCDEAQGYYFGRPVPAEEFATLLASGVATHLLTHRPQFAGASLSKLPS